MNDSELTSAIHRLPIPKQAQRDVLRFTKPPSPIHFIFAVALTLLAVLSFRSGYEGFLFAQHPPPFGTSIPAITAFVHARDVEDFYRGIFLLLLGIAHLVFYYVSRQRYRVSHLLLSCAIQSKCA